MLILIIKILLCFLTIKYSIVLLKEIHRLKRYPFLHASCFIGLTIILIAYHNFFRFYPDSAETNFQILKLVCCILLMRIPVVFLHWLLIGTFHLTIDKENAVKLNRAGWYPIRRMNRSTVVNGISSLKVTNNNLVWALMLFLLCGNWISQHSMLGVFFLGALICLKTIQLILKNLKDS
jgi:hypothetical protein